MYLLSETHATCCCRHAETHFKGSFYTIAALDGMTRKHLQNVIVDACRQSVHECVLCLGHNKGWEEAASSFAVSIRPQGPYIQITDSTCAIKLCSVSTVACVASIRLSCHSPCQCLVRHNNLRLPAVSTDWHVWPTANIAAMLDVCQHLVFELCTHCIHGKVETPCPRLSTLASGVASNATCHLSFVLIASGEGSLDYCT